MLLPRRFWSSFGSQNGPQNWLKIGQNIVNFSGPILDPFFLGFWSSLGASWEPSWPSWGCLGTPLDPKTFKNYRFFKVFENAAFWLFEAPDGSLGLILLLLGQIWSQNGVPKWVPKVVLNDIKKLILRASWKMIKNVLVHFWVPFWTSFGAHFWNHFGTQNWSKIS